MFIAIYGPQGSGQTTVAKKLFDHFNSTGIETHIIHEKPIHGTNLNSPIFDIYSILQNRKKGIVITDGLEITRNNLVQIEKNGACFTPDVILRTSTEDCVTQMWVTEDTKFEDILTTISIDQNIKHFETLRHSTT